MSFFISDSLAAFSEDFSAAILRCCSKFSNTLSPLVLPMPSKPSFRVSKKLLRKAQIKPQLAVITNKRKKIAAFVQSPCIKKLTHNPPVPPNDDQLKNLGMSLTSIPKIFFSGLEFGDLSGSCCSGS